MGPLLTMPVTRLDLNVSEVSWSLRDIRIVFAPRLTWRSRNRLLTSLCHLIWPTRFPKGSLYSRNISFWGDFRSGGRDHMRHLTPLLLLTSGPGNLLLDKSSWANPQTICLFTQVSLGRTCPPSLTHTPGHVLHRNITCLDIRRKLCKAASFRRLLIPPECQQL